VSHDKHVGVDYSADVMPQQDPKAPPSAELIARRKSRALLRNHGVTKLERLDGNVGYLKIDAFYDPADGGGTIAAAMTFLANTDALVIDLRDNHGGRPGMVALLASYLLDGEPVHLNDIWVRDGNETRQSWSLAYVPGPRYLGKPVYLLTSRETISAGEEFANDLKVLKRATVVGDTTAGAANPGGVARITDHFGIFVPGGRAINPITKTNWEGTGVAPDVVVPADRALDTARVLALKAILAGSPGPDLEREVKAALAAAQGGAAGGH
jgi:C-terminal processing protease CtpA/Prc